MSLSSNNVCGSAIFCITCGWPGGGWRRKSLGRRQESKFETVLCRNAIWPPLSCTFATVKCRGSPFDCGRAERALYHYYFSSWCTSGNGSATSTSAQQFTFGWGSPKLPKSDLSGESLLQRPHCTTPVRQHRNLQILAAMSKQPSLISQP